MLTNSEVISNNAVNGAGLLNSSTSFIYATLTEIRGNKASGNGGGLQNNTGTTHLTNVGFISNRAGGDGGGFYNNASGTVILTLHASNLQPATSGSGGGIFNGKLVRVVDSAVNGNEAGQNGGGLYNTAGTSTILNTSFIPGTVAPLGVRSPATSMGQRYSSATPRFLGITPWVEERRRYLHQR